MARRNQKKPTNEPRWKLLEKVAALLERNFDRDAVIRRNEKLPELGNPGSLRECDITVRSGPTHRQWLTIVEVQKRARKVEITTFDGWVTKMAKVGAQHLIAVSEKGFPSSVLHRAVQLGPTVRLATISELKRGVGPQTGLTALVLIQSHVDDVTQVELLLERQSDRVGTKGNLPPDHLAFRDTQGHPHSLNSIAKASIAGLDTLKLGKNRVSYVTAERYAFVDDEAIGLVRIKMVIDVTRTEERPVLDMMEYKQVDDATAASWVMTGKTAPESSVGERAVHLVFRADKSGRLVPTLMHVEGLGAGDQAFVSMTSPGFILSALPPRGDI